MAKNVASGISPFSCAPLICVVGHNFSPFRQCSSLTQPGHERFIDRVLHQLQPGLTHTAAQKPPAPHLDSTESTWLIFKNTAVSLCSPSYVGTLWPGISMSREECRSKRQRWSQGRPFPLQGWAQRKQPWYKQCNQRDVFQRENMTHRRFRNHN